MPHYQDGTEAKVGDLVRGKLYNTPKDVVGTVVSVTPNAESCNCTVAFVEVTTIGKDDKVSADKATTTSYDGQRVAMRACFDYGETKAFSLVFRPGSEAAAPP